jgi:hypothetical protein
MKRARPVEREAPKAAFDARYNFRARAQSRSSEGARRVVIKPTRSIAV